MGGGGRAVVLPLVSVLSVSLFEKRVVECGDVAV